MTISNHKILLVQSLLNDKKIANDIYKLKSGEIINIKVSKIHTGDHYWFTINDNNIKNFDVHKVTNYVFSGPKGYYNIPIKILKLFFNSYPKKPKDGKYHFGVYFSDHTLRQTNKNIVDISKYYNELPKELKDNINPDDSNIIEAEPELVTPPIDRNYFTFETSRSSINSESPNGNEEFEWTTNLQHHKAETNIGDIVFFSQYGDKSRISWDQGLSAICEITKVTDLSGKNFKVNMKPILILPKVLHRREFKGYFNLYDIKGIGPMTQGQKSQPNTLISYNIAKEILGVITLLLPQVKRNIKNIFGKDFQIIETNGPSLEPVIKDFNLDEIPINPVDSDESRNLILYGAPGTGKSFSLKGKVNSLFPAGELRTRITFHPNYSYRNFVGSYKPKPIYKDGDVNKTYYDSSKSATKGVSLEPMIEYVFEPGPFLEMLIKAHHNLDHNFVIVIEELNRANTAAVFGDIFQLLDRDDSGKSEYPITLEKSAHVFLKENGIDDDEIAIPSNLYLWATMNNADQGVMPMDSAFKRRWSFEHLKLNELEGAMEGVKINFPWNFEIEWNEFRGIINKELGDKLNVHEDKFIGPFFLKEEEIKDNKIVLNKLLLYLKEDVLRYKPGIFKTTLKTFSDISEMYMPTNEDTTREKDKIKPDNVFLDELNLKNDK